MEEGSKWLIKIATHQSSVSDDIEVRRGLGGEGEGEGERERERERGYGGVYGVSMKFKHGCNAIILVSLPNKPLCSIFSIIVLLFRIMQYYPCYYY